MVSRGMEECAQTQLVGAGLFPSVPPSGGCAAGDQRRWRLMAATSHDECGDRRDHRIDAAFHVGEGDHRQRCGSCGRQEHRQRQVDEGQHRRDHEAARAGSGRSSGSVTCHSTCGWLLPGSRAASSRRNPTGEPGQRQAQSSAAGRTPHGRRSGSAGRAEAAAGRLVAGWRGQQPVRGSAAAPSGRWRSRRVHASVRVQARRRRGSPPPSNAAAASASLRLIQAANRNSEWSCNAAYQRNVSPSNGLGKLLAALNESATSTNRLGRAGTP